MLIFSLQLMFLYKSIQRSVINQKYYLNYNKMTKRGISAGVFIIYGK